MQPQMRVVLTWAPYILVSVVHVVALAVGSSIAGPTKLLLMALLAVPVLCATHSSGNSGALKLLLAAIFFSWLGDGVGDLFSVGLELPLMLALFGFAHLAYIVAYIRYVRVRSLPRWTLIYAAWWIVMVSRYRFPCWRPARTRRNLWPDTRRNRGNCGSMQCDRRSWRRIFLASDSLLAFGLFLPDTAPDWFGPAVMATYAPGQGLIISGALATSKRHKTEVFGSGLVCAVRQA